MYDVIGKLILVCTTTGAVLNTGISVQAILEGETLTALIAATAAVVLFELRIHYRGRKGV
jgi:hypothetical protein